MFCSISGVVPKKPVFAQKTQLIYEQSLILKALKISEKCPVTDIQLNDEDLIEIKSPAQLHSKGSETRAVIVPPRTTDIVSVPDLLQKVATEWDATMLQVFELRKQLQATQEELVRTLYERDAAIRVIARLHDTSKDNVMKDMEIEAPSISNEEGFKEKLVRDSGELAKQRKQSKKAIQAKAIGPEAITKFQLISDTLHETTKQSTIANIGLLGNRIITANQEDNVTLYDNKLQVIQSDICQNVNEIHICNEKNIFLSLSTESCSIFTKASDSDSVVKTKEFDLKAEADFKDISIYRAFIHPSGDLIFFFSLKGHFLVSAIDTGKKVFSSSKIVEKLNTQELSAISLHVDGILLGFSILNSSILNIWNIKENEIAAEITFKKDTNSEDSINTIVFSNSGTMVAVGGKNILGLCDLRKQMCLHEALLLECLPFHSYTVLSLCFDSSGKYFCYAVTRNPKVTKDEQAKRMRVSETTRIVILYLQSKSSARKVNEFEVQDRVSSLCFGENAFQLYVGTKMGKLLLFQ